MERERLSQFTIDTNAKLMGRDLSRWMAALWATKGMASEAFAYFDSHYGPSMNRDLLKKHVENLGVKAATPPGNTNDAVWAQPLIPVTMTNFAFIPLLAQASLFGKTPGLRLVPFHAQVARQTVGGVYWWIGQGLPKGDTAFAFSPARISRSGAASGQQYLRKDVQMNRRAVFLDLNGTLVMPIMVEHLCEWRLIEDAALAVGRLSSAGLICPVVTVQSRIAKGLFSEDDFTGGSRSVRRPLPNEGHRRRPLRVSAPIRAAMRVQEASHLSLRACRAGSSDRSWPFLCGGRLCG
jgi:hypothetical protein